MIDNKKTKTPQIRAALVPQRKLINETMVGYRPKISAYKSARFHTQTVMCTYENTNLFVILFCLFIFSCNRKQRNKILSGLVKTPKGYLTYTSINKVTLNISNGKPLARTEDSMGTTLIVNSGFTKNARNKNLR